MLAKVVRSCAGSNGERCTEVRKNSLGVAVKEKSEVQPPSLALHFESGAHGQSNGNGHVAERERRSSARRRLAVPIRVRAGNIPWFEEAMTLDVSADGLRFLSSREYRSGEHLFVSFESLTSAPWLGAKPGARP